MQNLRSGLPLHLGHRPRHPHSRVVRPKAEFSLPLAREVRWPGCTRFAQLLEWCLGREETGCRVRADVLRCRCLNALRGSRIEPVCWGLHSSETILRPFCDRCQSSGAGAPRPPLPHFAVPVGSASCHRPRGASLPRRAPNRSVRSRPCTGEPQGGPHSIRSAAGSLHGEIIDSVFCEQGRCVAMPELAWGQQDRASPGSKFKRIHIVRRRRLPLKVPSAASRCPCR